MKIAIKGIIWRTRNWEGEVEYVFRDHWQDLSNVYIKVCDHEIVLDDVELDENAAIQQEVAFIDKKIETVQLAAHDKIEELKFEKSKILAITHQGE
jgi:hypothetical protein